MAFASLEEMRELVAQCMDEIPEALYRELNLGVVLEERAKPHPLRQGDDLYILGEYHRTRLGRQIVLYYGSFERLFSYMDEKQLKARIRKTLRHEFQHHLEFLAGDSSLVKQDTLELERYFTRKEKKNK